MLNQTRPFSYLKTLSFNFAQSCSTIFSLTCCDWNSFPRKCLQQTDQVLDKHLKQFIPFIIFTKYELLFTFLLVPILLTIYSIGTNWPVKILGD